MTRKLDYAPPCVEVCKFENMSLLMDLSYHQAMFDDLIEQDEWGLQP